MGDNKPFNSTGIQMQRENRSFIHLIQVALCSILLLFTCSACASGTGLLGGERWQASGLTNQHIRALAVDTNNPQVLYAGSAQGSIFVSTDAGQHWTKRSTIAPSLTIVYTLTFNTSGKKFYALTDAGLFVSTDAAHLWNVVRASGLPSDSYTTMTFTTGQSEYVGTIHHGVFASNDDGVTWKSASGNLPQSTAINELTFDSTQHRLWAATTTGVYRSDDEGRFWLALDSGLSTAGAINTIQSAAGVGGAAGLVYAGTNHGIYRSLDAGSHWTANGQALRRVSIYHALLDFRSKNASTIYVGTNFGAFGSADGGLNWQGIAGGIPADTPVYALVIGANNASQLYAAADDVYVFPGSNNGISPTRIVSLLLIVLLFFLLYLVARRSLGRRKTPPKPERTVETTPAAEEH